MAGLYKDYEQARGIIELVYIVLQSVVKPGITGFFKIDLHIKCYIYLKCTLEIRQFEFLKPLPLDSKF